MSVITGAKVLIVEDDQDSMDVVLDILNYHNVESYGVYTAEEALAFLEKTVPTLAIVDLALPQMDGWGLLRTMRDNPATAAIPIVAITAYHSVRVAHNAVRAGFNAYFAKPIEVDSFVNELDRIVKGG